MMLDFIRGIVRPTLAWGFGIAWIAFEAVAVARGRTPSTEFVAAGGLIIAAYFVERILEKANGIGS